MLTAISLTTCALGIYVWYEGYPFHMGTLYYIAQTITFLILFIITAAVYEININRYHRINKQFKE